MSSYTSTRSKSQVRNERGYAHDDDLPLRHQGIAPRPTTAHKAAAAKLKVDLLLKWKFLGLVMRQQKYSPTDLDIAWRLLDRHKVTLGYAYDSNKMIAKYAGVREATVIDSIKRLTHPGSGAFERILRGRPGIASRYRPKFELLLAIGSLDATVRWTVPTQYGGPYPEPLKKPLKVSKEERPVALPRVSKIFTSKFPSKKACDDAGSNLAGQSRLASSNSAGTDSHPAGSDSRPVIEIILEQAVSEWNRRVERRGGTGKKIGHLTARMRQRMRRALGDLDGLMMATLGNDYPDCDTPLDAWEDLLDRIEAQPWLYRKGPGGRPLSLYWLIVRKYPENIKNVLLGKYRPRHDQRAKRWTYPPDFDALPIPPEDRPQVESEPVNAAQRERDHGYPSAQGSLRKWKERRDLALKDED